MYEISSVRPKLIELLYNALSNIPPTSVECERVFSDAGRIISNRRRSMSDSVLNAVVFLKQFY